MDEYLLKDDITDDIVIIKVGRSYYPGISAQKLYDITRGCWKRRIESVERANYALTVFKGTVLEVYRIFGWYRAEDEIRRTVPYTPELDDGRIIFRGEVASAEIREKYIGKNVNKLFQWGEASPIKTFFSTDE